ncbi:MAG TPA: DUF3810 domain-containing protein [Ferruginibacter sp.]|nr:DUF3810 domain-containing protein [Bacteroidota bacterium]MCC6693286.1 DUF3810 domain-containing protein [Chitinophagaceae bacterium]HMT95378.1 DUF3810 domain-containing protein [Ferruginibacter sp.]HMU24057.1 DUF3810 domain-containing protein [Ferruginibacter sp.]
MRNLKNWVYGCILFLACISIRLYSLNPARVESGYSTGFFPGFSAFQRTVFGKIPFCIGDIIYLLLFFWLIALFSVFLSSLVRNKKIPNFFHTTLKCLFSLMALYIIFNVFWGLNYNRKGIKWQLGLPEREQYSTEDLRNLNCLLLDNINQSKRAIMNGQKKLSSGQLFKKVDEAYQSAAVQFPFLQYQPVSIKPGLWGNWQSYTGISGYYNPFTGEAQMNMHLPDFILPYTACHEVAHQLGYAKEMEANFVGYIAAVSSKDTLFHYSAYIDLFMYANMSLYFSDSSFARICRNDLLPQVKEDYKRWRNFKRTHQSFMNPVITVLYGNFLKQNQQPLGMQSYNAVTGFLIDWYKKYGKI